MTEPRDGSTLEQYRRVARRWLQENAPARASAAHEPWGTGSDDVAVFHNLTYDEELALLQRIQRWHQLKCDAGFGAITWTPQYGGAGLSAEHDAAFREEEAAFEVPTTHEVFGVTTALIAPTIRVFGTDVQKVRLLRSFVRADQICCQLFSEPSAGSDLASIATSAVRDGDGWVINGQKVWSSGAAFASWGEVIARTDVDVPKHAGLTAFLLPMDSPGVDVRPIRQMSGGTSFCEVFFTDVRVPDELRLGPEGAGWEVALTTLQFERNGTSEPVGGTWNQVLRLAQWSSSTDDPLTRQLLVDLYIRLRVEQLSSARFALTPVPPGEIDARGSLRKLMWSDGLTRVSEAVAQVLGPRLVADTGEWGTYTWAEHVLGAPGYRIAGGTDEIQRNIIGERLLGLPAEPKLDRDLPWRAKQMPAPIDPQE